MPTWGFHFTADSLECRVVGETSNDDNDVLCPFVLFCVVFFVFPICLPLCVSFHVMVFRVSCGFFIPLNSLLKDWTFDGGLMPCIGHFWNLPPMPMDDPHKSVCHMFLDAIFIVRPYHCIYTCHHIMNILFIL